MKLFWWNLSGRGDITEHVIVVATSKIEAIGLYKEYFRKNCEEPIPTMLEKDLYDLDPVIFDCDDDLPVIEIFDWM